MTMRVFVTGATGYLGSAIVDALLEGGHEVSGLTSSDDKVAALEAKGVRAAVGGLEDPGSWRRSAVRADAVVHAAFDYGAEDPVALDRLAIDTLLSAAGEGSGSRVLVYTSGVWVLGETGEREADESAATDHPFELTTWRPGHERTVLDAAGKGSGRLVSSVVRPGVLYGGRRGLMIPFFRSAAEEGAATYVGDGQNRMALVHKDDVGRLYRAVLELFAGGVFHAVDGSPMTMLDVARAASEAAGAEGKTRSVPLAEARGQLGKVADALCLDQVVSARRSNELLAWAPHYPSFREGAPAAYREWRGEA
jgi:nucleoside-diphosphate-sugar epimerase